MIKNHIIFSMTTGENEPSRDTKSEDYMKLFI